MSRPRASLARYYDIENVAYVSDGFKEHQGIVLAAYGPLGFIADDMLPSEVVDEHDGAPSTHYFLLRIPDTRDVAGTFRTLEAGSHTLPLFRAYPHLCIGPVMRRFCETTRLVSTRRQGLVGKTSVTRHVAFEAVIRSMAYAKANGLWGMVSLASPGVFAYIHDTFYGVKHGLAPPSEYQGGVVIPSVVWLDEFESVLARRAAHLYDYFLAALDEVS